ncbi:MAG: metallophosphoesterase [Sulfurimonas sp.]
MTPTLFFIAYVLAFGLQTYLIKRLFIDDIKLKNKRYLSRSLYILFAISLLYPLARYFPLVPNWLYFLLSLPIGVLFLTFGIAIVHKLVSFGCKRLKLNQKRRDFFRKTLDIGSTSLILATNLKAVDNARHIELEVVDIELKNLKKPYKLVQLSDVHIGGLIDREFIKNLVKKVNVLSADVVVITGDLVDTKLEFAKSAIDELSGLKSTYGTYFVVGNHEYFHGVSPIIEYLKSIDIRVLENENIYIGADAEGFNLAGVYDLFGFRYAKFEPDINKALKGVKVNSPTLLLAHQPKYINFLHSTEGIDLMLSGHTHGGQLWPFNFLVALEQPYVKGLHKHNEHTQVYVNKGTGFWGPPMRLGASSEITLINLT